MAYVVSVRSTSGTASTSGTFTGYTYPALENDLILVQVAFRDGFPTFAISGYTALDSKRSGNLYSSQWLVKKAGASESQSLPVTTGRFNSAFNVIAYVIRDADVSGTAAQAIATNGINYVIGGATQTVASPTLTPTEANCLLVHGVTYPAQNLIAPISSLNIMAHGVNAAATASGVAFHESASTAIPTFSWTSSNNAGGASSGVSWVVAVKNASSGNLPVRLTDNRTFMQLLGGYSTLTTGIPDSVTGLTAISSVNMNTVANTSAGSLTISVTQPSTIPWPFSGTSFSSTQTITAEAWVGSFVSNTQTSVSGKILSIPYGFSGTTDGARVGSKGVIVVLVDNANKWVAYQVVDQPSIVSNGSGFLAIRPGTTTVYDESTGIDLTKIEKIGYFYHRLTATSTAAGIIFMPPILEPDVSVVVGGGSGNYVGMLQISKLVLCADTFVGEASIQGSGQLVNKIGLQIGDGSTVTYFKHTAQSYDVPSTLDLQWRVGTGGAPLKIKASSTDIHDLRASIITSSILQPFTIDAASSLSASLLTTGLSVIGRTFSDLAGYDWTSVSWTECDTVAFKNGDVTTCTISSPNAAVHATTGAACSFSAAGAIVSGTTINCNKASGVTGYHLELGTAVTAITLTDVTFTGTPGTDKIHVLKTLTTVSDGSFVVGVHYRINTAGTTNWTAIGGAPGTVGTNFTATGVGGAGTGTADQAVKITISGTTSLAEADVTTAGAPAWVAAPALNQVVVVSGFTAGSRIQIYDTTSSTELFNGTATAGDTVVTGSTATWTDPLAASANRAIRVRVAYISGVTAEQWQQFSGLTCGQTSGTESITYPVTPIDDDTYNSNAINGPTIYATSGITFTDAATDLVNISIAGGTVTWPTIYACFVYWLSTAAGIDDDVAYIDAPDTANYLLTSMKLKNTHANPLTVTSGYGRSATTGLVADIIDTAGSTGNIFPSPDHVVAYATGSGALTAGDITNIWSAATRTITTTIPTASQVSTQVLTDAQTTPIHSDVRKVNSYTVDGNGQTGTEWGPV